MASENKPSKHKFITCMIQPLKVVNDPQKPKQSIYLKRLPKGEAYINPIIKEPAKLTRNMSCK